VRSFSLFGLRLTEGGGPFLAGFYETLALARARFEADGEPTLTSQDVGQLAVLSKAHPSALLEIVDREAPFLGSTTPQSSADMWVREVSTAVVNYWRAETIDDYLRIRAEELRRSPTSHWPAPEPAAAEPADVEEPHEGQLGVFISHASEDKADVARPIAEGLEAAGWTVWLDQYELTVGDSLFQRINHGLARSRCGIVVLSESFFAKHWPKQELDALAAKESASGAKVILPVWHGIDEHYLAREAPMLAGRLGVSTHKGIPYVVEQLTRALAKELGSETTHGNSEPVFRSARTSDPPPAAPGERHEASTANAEPFLVLAPPSQHRLNDPHQVTPPPQVMWAQTALVDVENVGTAVAFIRNGGADAVGAGAVTVKPPTAVAPGATRPVELVVSTMTADARIAAGQLVRFWLDYGSGEDADRRLWAVAQYNAGGGWANVGSDNRPLV
jgi:TIR domain